MAPSLVGQGVALSIGATGSSLVAQFPQIPTPGNLLVAFWAANKGLGVSTAPTGWTTGSGTASGNSEAETYVKIAQSNETPPTFSAISTAVITVGIAEFAGVLAFDAIGNKAGGASSYTGSLNHIDAAAGELVVASHALAMSPAGAATMVPTFNNGATANILYTDATDASLTNHVCFVYGITSSKAVVTTFSMSDSGTPGLSGGSGAGATFLLAPNPQAPALVSGTFVTRRDR